jgi:Uma2 family endonuclease
MSDVILHVDPASPLIAERERLGLDTFDEMWEGVAHVVPPPSVPHQDAEGELHALLRARARELGLRCTVNTGVFDPDRPDHSFRVPDIVVARPEQRSHRGIEGGAVLVVEILSPRDETYEKLPFYAAQGCEQVLIVHPMTFALQLLVNDGGTLVEVEPDEDGAVTLHTLDLRLCPVPDEGLDAWWPGGSAEVRP